MGISTAIAGLVETIGAALGTTVAAGTAATIGTIGAGALEGAALGAGTSALEHKNIGKGALLGGLTGGLGGGATVALEGAGVGATAAEGLGGLVGGTGAGLITGEKFSDALKGGIVSGGLSLARGALTAPASPSGGNAPAAGGGSSSAASTAAPASVGAVDPNVTAPAGSSLPGTGGGGSGLPGSFGTGAAGETGSAALGSESSFGGAPSSGGSTSVAPSAPSVSGGGDVVITGNPSSVPAIMKLPAIDALGPVGAQHANDNPGKKMMADALHNPSLLLAGGGLAANLLAGNKKPVGFGALENQAQSELAQGRQQESYLGNGTLPPGLQQGIDSATQSAAATIRSQYASRGMSGSSAEAQDLASLQQRATTQGAQMAMQLYQQGVQESQLADSIYAQLMGVQQEQDKETSSAVGGFAAALAGMGRTGTTG